MAVKCWICGRDEKDGLCTNPKCCRSKPVVPKKKKAENGKDK